MNAEVFELWDATARNMMEDFDTESDALDAVRQMVEEFGPDYLDDVLLIRGPRHGGADMHPVAAGAALVALAQRTAVSAA